jgi:hypothetical protein
MMIQNCKDKLEIIGLMSGTSLDGLDIAHVLFHFNDQKLQFNLLNCETIAYDTEILIQLHNYNTLSVPEMLMLDKKIGRFYGKKVNEFIQKYPQASEAKEAKERYEKMVYEQTTADRTFQSYKKYFLSASFSFKEISFFLNSASMPNLIP